MAVVVLERSGVWLKWQVESQVEGLVVQWCERDPFFSYDSFFSFSLVPLVPLVGLVGLRRPGTTRKLMIWSSWPADCLASWLAGRRSLVKPGFGPG